MFLPAVGGFALGFIATCWLAAFLLGFGAPAETPGFFHGGVVLTVVHLPLMAVAVLGKGLT